MGKSILKYMCCSLATVLFLIVCTVAEAIKPDETGQDFSYDNERKDIFTEADNISAEDNKYPVYETESFVCYEDRILRRQGCDVQNAVTMSGVINEFLEMCPSINKAYVIPVPHRIVVEDGYEEEKESYEQYVIALAENLDNKACTVDTVKAMQQHGLEYIFFRTEDAWTLRGAYYGMQELCKAMQRDSIPLSEYEEYDYNSFLGGLVLEEELIGCISSDLQYDRLYYYLMPDSKNAVEVMYADEGNEMLCYKKPLITNSGTNLGAIIEGGYTRAIVEGESLDGEGTDKNIMLICDERGKLLAPYLKDYYNVVYVVNIKEDYNLTNDINVILDVYNISEVVIAQSAVEMGAEGYYRALSNVLER